VREGSDDESNSENSFSDEETNLSCEKAEADAALELEALDKLFIAKAKAANPCTTEASESELMSAVQVLESMPGKIPKYCDMLISEGYDSVAALRTLDEEIMTQLGILPGHQRILRESLWKDLKKPTPRLEHQVMDVSAELKEERKKKGKLSKEGIEWEERKKALKLPQKEPVVEKKPPKVVQVPKIDRIKMDEEARRKMELERLQAQQERAKSRGWHSDVRNRIAIFEKRRMETIQFQKDPLSPVMASLPSSPVMESLPSSPSSMLSSPLNHDGWEQFEEALVVGLDEGTRPTSAPPPPGKPPPKVASRQKMVQVESEFMEERRLMEMEQFHLARRNSKEKALRKKLVKEYEELKLYKSYLEACPDSNGNIITSMPNAKAYHRLMFLKKRLEVEYNPTVEDITSAGFCLPKLLSISPPRKINEEDLPPLPDRYLMFKQCNPGEKERLKKLEEDRLAANAWRIKNLQEAEEEKNLKELEAKALKIRKETDAREARLREEKAARDAKLCKEKESAEVERSEIERREAQQKRNAEKQRQRLEEEERKRVMEEERRKLQEDARRKLQEEERRRFEEDTRRRLKEDDRRRRAKAKRMKEERKKERADGALADAPKDKYGQGFHAGERWMSPADDPWQVPHWLWDFTNNRDTMIKKVVQLIRNAHPPTENREDALRYLYEVNCLAHTTNVNGDGPLSEAMLVSLAEAFLAKYSHFHELPEGQEEKLRHKEQQKSRGSPKRPTKRDQAVSKTDVDAVEPCRERAETVSFEERVQALHEDQLKIQKHLAKKIADATCKQKSSYSTADLF